MMYGLTRSPGGQPSTPSPSSSTSPASSTPSVCGRLTGKREVPSRTSTSRWLSALARILTSTSPGPGLGSSTSSTRSTSMPPNSWNRTAFTRSTSLPAGRPLRLCLTSGSLSSMSGASRFPRRRVNLAAPTVELRRAAGLAGAKDMPSGEVILAAALAVLARADELLDRDTERQLRKLVRRAERGEDVAAALFELLMRDAGTRGVLEGDLPLPIGQANPPVLHHDKRVSVPRPRVRLPSLRGILRIGRGAEAEYEAREDHTLTQAHRVGAGAGAGAGAGDEYE